MVCLSRARKLGIAAAVAWMKKLVKLVDCAKIVVAVGLFCGSGWRGVGSPLGILQVLIRYTSLRYWRGSSTAGYSGFFINQQRSDSR
jgi:hypothetical protein